MEATKVRLGRGLESLIGGQDHREGMGHVEVDKIRQNPFQPRKRFDDDELHQLTASVKTHGILQPLVVRKSGDHYQLIAGERRLRAAQAAGMNSVPVHVVEFNDQEVYEAALVENIQRSDLNPIEKAQGFKDYMDHFGMTQDALGAKLGLDRTTISNLVGLLNLPTEVQDAVRLNQISVGHAKLLKGLADHSQQLELCKETILKNLSVHALDQLIKERKQAAQIVTPTKEPVEKYEKTAHVVSLENELRERLAVRVEIKVKAREKGQFVIGFDTNDDFERILEALRK